MVHFLGNCKVITGCLFIWILPERVEGVKKVCRPSLLCFPPAMSPFSRMELMLKEHPPVKHKLFPIVRNKIVPHQFRRNCHSTSVSLNRSKASQDFFSNLVLLLPSWMCRSQSVSEKSRAPLSANALNNFGLVVSH